MAYSVQGSVLLVLGAYMECRVGHMQELLYYHFSLAFVVCSLLFSFLLGWVHTWQCSGLIYS